MIASVPVDPSGPPGTRVVRGMTMNSKNMNGKSMTGKTKFLILGLLLVVVLSFFLDHFWNCTVCTLGIGKAVASAVVVFLLVISKVLARIVSMHFLL
jgi:hypothetical protein